MLKLIHRKLPNFDSIELYSIADVHWESAEADQGAFLRFIDFILDKPNRYVVLNGDLLDMALTLSVSDTYSATEAPQSAIDTFAKVLSKIKDRVLAAQPGNHEDRVYKYTGIDVTEHLFLKAGIDIAYYSKMPFVLLLEFSDVKYVGYFHHGFGGGRMQGGKVNNSLRLAETVIADFYSSGHVHTPNATGTMTFLVDLVNNILVEFKQYFIITNAWLSTGGYGLKHGFRPTLNDIFYYRFSGSKKSISMHTLDFKEEYERKVMAL
jgi:UDP-2,3-diacylglucosamine pyrophosphatase LpxH